MEERTSTITISGKEYELVFTTRATKEVTKRFGSLKQLGDTLINQSTEQSLEDVVWLVTLLANQGIQRKNMLEHTNEPLLTEEQVEILTTPGDYVDFNSAIQEAIIKGTQRFVVSETKN